MNASETADAVNNSLIPTLADYCVIGINHEGIPVVVAMVRSESAAALINNTMLSFRVESAEKGLIWRGFTLEQIEPLMKQLNVTRYSAVDTDGGYLVKDLDSGQYIPAPGK